MRWQQIELSAKVAKQKRIALRNECRENLVKFWADVGGKIRKWIFCAAKEDENVVPESPWTLDIDSCNGDLVDMES